ncbi:hypothetical protein ABK040_007546 [Willaertia magna]
MPQTNQRTCENNCNKICLSNVKRFHVYSPCDIKKNRELNLVSNNNNADTNRSNINSNNKCNTNTNLKSCVPKETINSGQPVINNSNNNQNKSTLNITWTNYDFKNDGKTCNKITSKNQSDYIKCNSSSKSGGSNNKIHKKYRKQQHLPFSITTNFSNVNSNKIISDKKDTTTVTNFIPSFNEMSDYSPKRIPLQPQVQVQTQTQAHNVVNTIMMINTVNVVKKNSNSNNNCMNKMNKRIIGRTSISIKDLLN